MVLDFIDVTGKLANIGMSGKNTLEGWSAKLKGDLKSAMAGGQWPQVRVHQVPGWSDTANCQLCKVATGTLEHRFCCPVTSP